MPISGKLLTAVLVGSLGLVGAAGQTQDKDADHKPDPAPPVTLPFSRLKPDAVIEAAGERAILSAGDAVWIASREAGTIARIDAKAGTVSQTVKLAAPPCAGLGEGFGAIWVPLCGAPAGLARVDSKTNAVTATISRGIATIGGTPATAVASIWLLTDANGTLGRFDPDGNVEVAEVYLGSPVNALAFGQGALWATSGRTDTLLRISPYTNLVVETIKVGKGPRALAIGEGAVWTLNAGDGTVSRVDPKTNKVEATVKLGVGVAAIGGAIAVGEGSIWLTTAAAPLVRIDPRTNRVVQIFTGAGGGAVAIGQGAVWVTSSPTAVWRLDPRRIEATRQE